MSKPFDFRYSQDEEIDKIRKAEVLGYALADQSEGMRRLRLRCLGKEERLLEIIKTHEDFKDDDEISQKLFKILTSSKDLEAFRWGANLLLRLNPENINLRNQDGETLLHLVATFADANSISRLVSEMSDEVIRAQNSKGESFLDYLLEGREMSISRQRNKEKEDLEMKRKGHFRFSDLEVNQKISQEKAQQRRECFQDVVSAIFAKYKEAHRPEHGLVRDFFAPILLELKNPSIAIERQMRDLKPRLKIAEDKPFLTDLFLVTNFLSNEFKTKFVRFALSINNPGDRVNLKHLQVLLDCGFDLNFRFSDNSQTLLIRCARNQETEAVAALCRSEKVDINAVDLDGKSALHFALEGGNVGMANMLIDAGINLEYVKIQPDIGAPGLLQILRRKFSEAQSDQDRQAYGDLYSKITKKNH